MSLPRFRTKITGPKQVSVSVTSAPQQRFQLNGKILRHFRLKDARL
jgi:hypothetical protein